MNSIHSSSRRQRKILPLRKFLILSVRYFNTFYPFCPSFRLHFLLTLVLPNGPLPCFTVTHYSTHLKDQPEVPVSRRGAAFFFKNHSVTSESESKGRVFSPLPRIPDVNLTGADELLTRAKKRILGIAGMHSQACCDYTMIKETYALLMTQSKNCVNVIKLETSQATEEREKLADVMQSFLSKQCQKNVATLPRSRRFIGATPDLGAGAGKILEDPSRKTARTAVSLSNKCDDTGSLSKDVDDILRTQKYLKATFQRVQSANDGNFFLLGNEVRTTQENAKNLPDEVNYRLKTLNEKFTLIPGELTLYKEYAEKQAKHSVFLQEIRYLIFHLGTLYTHINQTKLRFTPTRLN